MHDDPWRLLFSCIITVSCLLKWRRQCLQKQAYSARARPHWLPDFGACQEGDQVFNLFVFGCYSRIKDYSSIYLSNAIQPGCDGVKM